MAKVQKTKKVVTAKKSAKAAPKATKKAAAPAKKAAPKKTAPTPTKKIPAPLPKLPLPRAGKKIIYIDSCLFFPAYSSDGYSDDYQAGRYANSDDGTGTLQAPIVLPVGAKINTITVYYKNTTQDDIQVNFVRKHTEHWASTEEYLISYEALSPAGIAPDYFSSVVINHFGDNKIKEKYLYYIMISMLGKLSDTEIRTIRGLRIDYSY
ncbi:hypothetical protein QTN47_01065 [Danxiaibacter flavus]|uniref:Uncharacterized protein n=1 Tax=Danxiaibacter flavus TaxID=3049108 RepID=A0ABV3Z878_9BACT|nr:hypothetical protein QNM32_01065 [Chitinophagaceae bacterium DXS]